MAVVDTSTAGAVERGERLGAIVDMRHGGRVDSCLPIPEETDTLLGDGSADDSSTNDSSDVDSWTSGNLLLPDTFEAIDTSGNATETTDAGGKDQ